MNPSSASPSLSGPPTGSVISAILRHDTKVTSYKLALLRAINDVALAFPDVRSATGGESLDVAVPLRILAANWVAYYWPFADPQAPIFQGPRSRRNGELRQDMAFRPAITRLRQEWETLLGGPARPADGFFLVGEMRIGRKRAGYPPSLVSAFEEAVDAAATAVAMPIRYAGPSGEQWSVFEKPVRLDRLPRAVVALPGASPRDVCLVISSELWDMFVALSLWVEALAIHEWCLFTERVEQQQPGSNGQRADRGDVYRLLTDRPDNRRPLSWERNQIDLLLLEGQAFTCPWTARRIDHPDRYHLDHIIPVSVYPINELWNLVPADPTCNVHEKRARLPSTERLNHAEPLLTQTYSIYQSVEELAASLAEDARLRFCYLPPQGQAFPAAAARAVTGFVGQLAEARNLARF